MKTTVTVALSALAATAFAFWTTIGAAQNDRFAPLRTDPEIENGVLIVAIGDIIRDHCPNIEDRRGRSILFLQGLVHQAQSLGFSMSEIQEYVDNPTEKARVEARAAQWFGQQGASLADSDSVCAVARDEIAADTAIGRLIRER
ncbi:hypothetical protein HKCCE2091_21005 [Rhodobacterales bacterium HKCCE2091]|nr:hypothetical protein [Rhodobacterales bacterium HKCCE2091]